MQIAFHTVRMEILEQVAEDGYSCGHWVEEQAPRYDVREVESKTAI